MRQYSQLTFTSYQISQVLTSIYHIGSLLVFITGLFVYHIGSLLVLITGLSWGSALWIFLLYFSRGMATTSIYHRLLTHRSYQAPKLVLYLGCIVAASAGQMGPSWWKAHHLDHHQHTDQALDPHSPYTPAQGIRGFLWSHMGWLVSSQWFPTKLPSDVENDRVLKVIDRLHFLPFIILGIISYWIGGLEYLGAFFLSTTLLFHSTQTVNSLAHIFGDQPFATKDQSRNNSFVASITLGEGWHNLHHAFQASCRQGITIRAGRVVYLPDPTFRFIKLLQKLNLASQLRIPTESDLLARAKSESSHQSKVALTSME